MRGCLEFKMDDEYLKVREELHGLNAFEGESSRYYTQKDLDLARIAGAQYAIDIVARTMGDSFGNKLTAVAGWTDLLRVKHPDDDDIARLDTYKLDLLRAYNSIKACLMDVPFHEMETQPYAGYENKPMLKIPWLNG